jgi:hypothetical protein
VVTSIVNAIPYTSGNPPVTLDANVTIFDGSASLKGGEVSLGLSVAAGDTLGYVKPLGNPVGGSYNSGTGVLTLIGSGTVAQFRKRCGR